MEKHSRKDYPPNILSWLILSYIKTREDYRGEDLYMDQVNLFLGGALIDDQATLPGRDRPHQTMITE